MDSVFDWEPFDGLTQPDNFSLGGWFTGAVLLLFALMVGMRSALYDTREDVPDEPFVSS
jgi:hypothetical protein